MCLIAIYANACKMCQVGVGVGKWIFLAIDYLTFFLLRNPLRFIHVFNDFYLLFHFFVRVARRQFERSVGALKN